MEGTFAVVLIVVVAAAAVVAVVSLVGFGDLYRSIGKGGLSLDEPDRIASPAPDTPAARAEAEAEIRQMVEAKSARREARGERPLDVDAEVAELTGRALGRDAALRDEVRQLVQARNERRLRRGEEPLDVEAEVERQLRELG
jgi:hypothetical protein